MDYYGETRKLTEEIEERVKSLLKDLDNNLNIGESLNFENVDKEERVKASFR